MLSVLKGLDVKIQWVAKFILACKIMTYMIDHMLMYLMCIHDMHVELDIRRYNERIKTS